MGALWTDRSFRTCSLYGREIETQFTGIYWDNEVVVSQNLSRYMLAQNIVMVQVELCDAIIRT
jgi:hypothetical protein